MRKQRRLRRRVRHHHGFRRADPGRLRPIQKPPHRRPNVCAPAATALTFGPSAAHNRNTSLIRRISELGLGIHATPTCKKRQRYLPLLPCQQRPTLPYWVAKSPASGDYFNRRQVAISVGPGNCIGRCH